jgi:uncharacterized protein YaaW (UPF0174 family)
VDEFKRGLALATDEELQMLAHVLFQPKFNPLDYFCTPQPVDVLKYDRFQQIDLIEQRFRYLAADGLTVLQNRTHQVSYRDTLLRVCRYLKIRNYEGLSATELESEVFLVLLEKSWQQLSKQEQRGVEQRLHSAIVSTQEFEQLPKVLQKKPLLLLAKGSSALALSAVVKPWLLGQIAKQFVGHWARYQVAQQTLVQGGLSVAAEINSRAAAKLATQSMAKASARYGAMRGALSFLGPALWTWFLADLGWRAVATNYGRVIPVVFALAQIRLIRESAWQAL